MENLQEQIPKTPEQIHEEFRAAIAELVSHITLEAKRGKPSRSLRFTEAPIGSRVFCNTRRFDEKTGRVILEEIHYDPSMFWDGPPGALYALLWHEYGHGQIRYRRMEEGDQELFFHELEQHEEAIKMLLNSKYDILIDADNQADHPGLMDPYAALYGHSFPRTKNASTEQFAASLAESELSPGAVDLVKQVHQTLLRPRNFCLGIKHEVYWHYADERIMRPQEEREPNPYIESDGALYAIFKQIRPHLLQAGNPRKSVTARSTEFNQEIATAYLELIKNWQPNLEKEIQNMIDQGKCTLKDAAELRDALKKAAEEKITQELQSQKQTAEALAAAAAEATRQINETVAEANQEVSNLEEQINQAKQADEQANSAAAEALRAGDTDLVAQKERESKEARKQKNQLEQELRQAKKKNQEIQEKAEPVLARMQEKIDEAKQKAAEAEEQINQQKQKSQAQSEGLPQDSAQAAQQIIQALLDMQKQNKDPGQDGAEQNDQPGDRSEQGQGQEKGQGKGEGQGQGEGQGNGKGKGEGKGKGKGKGRGQSQGHGQDNQSQKSNQQRRTYQPLHHSQGSGIGSSEGGNSSGSSSEAGSELEQLKKWGVSKHEHDQYQQVCRRIDNASQHDLVNGLIRCFAEDRQRVILTDLPHGSIPTIRKTEALRRRYGGEAVPNVREVRKIMERFMGVDIIVVNDHSGSMAGLREENAKAANISLARAAHRVNTEIAKRMRRLGFSELEIEQNPPLRYLGLLFSCDVSKMNERGWNHSLINRQTRGEDQEMDEEKFGVDLMHSYDTYMGGTNDYLAAAHALHQAFGDGASNIACAEQRVKVIYFITDGCGAIHEMTELMRYLHGTSHAFPEWLIRQLEYIEPGCSAKVRERIEKYRDQIFAIGVGIGGDYYFTNVYNEGKTPNEQDVRAYEDHNVIIVPDDQVQDLPKKLLRVTSAKFGSQRFRRIRAKYAKAQAQKIMKQKVA
ncbi:MAG: hypothetical protein ACOYUZ_04250 [Patescibacteria group bacterium]